MGVTKVLEEEVDALAGSICALLGDLEPEVVASLVTLIDSETDACAELCELFATQFEERMAVHPASPERREVLCASAASSAHAIRGLARVMRARKADRAAARAARGVRTTAL